MNFLTINSRAFYNEFINDDDFATDTGNYSDFFKSENIERLKTYRNDEQNKKWRPYHSNVVGELKHRSVALKQRLTLVSKIATYQIFE